MARRWSKKKRPAFEDKQVTERNLISHRVFDDKTLRVLVHFLDKGLFQSLDYPVSSGKESIVFRASKADGSFIAVKIFKYETSAFRKFAEYIQGDPRFALKDTLRARVHLWAQKEHANLRAAKAAGVHVPTPLAFRENVVVMEFIGEEGIAYPLLEQAALSKPKKALDSIVEDMRRTYVDAKLVHADLSGFNIMGAQPPVVIDWAQAVLRVHPRAEEFLLRDAHNVARFFQRRGVDVTEEDILDKIR
ncbi:serine protein kinase RIO [Candidatus Micrarchaeota archaeon]|nr:serine protein kinase RIO [Candidatus Micrarchaeota archaeon]